MIRDVPVDPDDEQARRWLEEELGRGDEPYQPPEPPGWCVGGVFGIGHLLSALALRTTKGI